MYTNIITGKNIILNWQKLFAHINVSKLLIKYFNFKIYNLKQLVRIRIKILRFFRLLWILNTYFII